MPQRIRSIANPATATSPDVGIRHAPVVRAGTPVADLARRVAAGDDGALADLYELRFEHVFLAAKRATRGDESRCLDVVQECFLRVLRNRSVLSRLRDDEHVDRWLACVAQRAALDLLRGERRRRLREATAESQDRPDGRELAERVEWLEKELAALPPEDRELLRLRGKGMTLSTVARVVGSTTGVVHGRLRRLVAGLTRSAKEAEHGK